MNGFIIIDKPKEFTSHDVVAKIRKFFDQKKVGHCGTLDPIATGVLVVALGEATKLVEYFLGCDKGYEAHAVLGSVSDTYDADGDVKKFSDKEPTEKEIETLLHKNFTGVIEQVPPKHSAVKIDGERAYDLARAGKEFSIKPRNVKIDFVEVAEYKYPDLKLKINCGKGTYIRSLIHDLGQMLKCGAYMKALRRTKIAHFGIADAITLDDLAEKHVLPIRDAVSHLNRVSLTDAEYDRLKNGSIVKNTHGTMQAPVFGYYKEEVVGVLEFPQNGRLLKFHKKLNIF
ncbi:tRNA pseudouridine(55) synthase TruB [Patescibacteria group bacterium]|nr:tRNA pseudouridine(55) synthase TruB [Patescibacteria group bacterium]